MKKNAYSKNLRISALSKPNSKTKSKLKLVASTFIRGAV
jgi:hypothetical protein